MKTFVRVGKGSTVVHVVALPNHGGYTAFIPGVSMLAVLADTIEEAVDAASGV